LFYAFNFPGPPTQTDSSKAAKPDFGMRTESVSMTKNSRDYKYMVEAGVTSRSLAERQLDIINVKDYGATGDGDTDDRTAILAAYAKARTLGDTSQGGMLGAIIYFPPGCYKVSAPLMFTHSNYGIHLEGAGKYATTIFGQFVGYIIDAPDINGATLNVIRGMRVRNTLNNPCAGAIRLSLGAGTAAGIIEDCMIQGFTGIDASANGYVTIIRNCEATAGFDNIARGSCFAYTQQASIENCRITRYDTAITCHNAASEFRSIAIENCFLGILVGADRGIACRASFTSSGGNTDMTISAIGKLFAFRGSANQPDWAGTTDGFATNETGVTPPRIGVSVGRRVYASGVPDGTSIASVISGSGGVGTYRLSANIGTLAEREVLVGPAGDAIAGCIISGIQTERCGTGIYVAAGTGVHITGVGITGTIGPQTTPSATPTYSAPNLTITTDTDYIATYPSTFSVTLESWTTSGVTINGTFTATKVNGSSFTINPGGNPGTISVIGNWSRECQYGIGVYGILNSKISACGLGLSAEVAGINLGDATQGTITNLTIDSIQSSWIMPHSTNQAGVKYINCDGSGFTQYLTSQRFLPGGDHGNGATSNLNVTIGDEYVVENVVDSAGGVPAVGDTVDPTDTPDAGGNGRLCRVQRGVSAWHVIAVLE
jgi:hypothetical protein